MIDVVCTDVQRNNGDSIRLEEAHRSRQLATCGIATDAAMNHRRGGLARAPELGELESRRAGEEHGVKVVDIALVRRGIRAARNLRLDALCERIAEGQIVGGLR